MSLKLDALLQTRPKSARIFGSIRLQKALKRPQTQKCGVSELPLTQGGPDTYPAGCWTIDKKIAKSKGLRSRLFGGQIWFPEGFRLGAKFGSLRGLDWGPMGILRP